MKFIKPVTVTDSILTASSIPEPDTGEVVWNAGTAYALNDKAYRATTHMIYNRIVAGTTATPPEDDDTNWEEFYPTNKWAMFDTRSNTVSVETGASAVEIEVTLVPGQVISSLYLGELDATGVQVVMKDTPGGTTVYDETYSLDDEELFDWYMYFFEPIDRKQSLVVNDLPAYGAGELTITIRSDVSVQVGQCVIGQVYELGVTEYGASAGIRDFSRIVENSGTGVIQVEERRYSKTMRARFKIDEDRANYVHRQLTSVLRTPVVWIADNDAGLEPLIIYGFYKDFSLDVAYPTISYYSLEVEGLS